MGNGIDKPLAYTLGEWDFYDLTLVITPDVLIPRPDTEILVETALHYLNGTRPDGFPVHIDSFAQKSKRVLDLCCGSGCVGLAVAKHSPVSVTFADISEAALAVAKRNGCTEVIRLDALQPPPSKTSLRLYDALLCNPPYIAESERDSLDPSVRDYEPHIALFSGDDGLEFYRSLLADWLTVLKPGGLFAVETGYTQAHTVAALARDAGLQNVAIRKDYAGHDRVVFGVVG